ncbi:MAG: sugar-binding domain-containing protein [Bryobacteraceae bacterium]
MARPPKKITPADIYTAAYLFYEKKKNRTFIAGKMGIDPRRVTQLLKHAVDNDVVRVQVYQTAEVAVEQGVRERFPKLDRVLVVPGSQIETEKQCDDLFRRMGRLAADYFERLYEEHPRGRPLHVGLTGGARLLEFSSAVSVRDRKEVRVHVTALVGRGQLGETESHVEPNVAASILWTHCGSFAGQCEYETVEPYRDTGSIGKTLKRLEGIPSIKAIVQDMDDLDVVFAGFGFLNNPDATDAWENRITMGSLLKSHVEPKQLSRAVGDFCYCPFDADGNGDARWRLFLTAGHYSECGGIDFDKRMVARKRPVVGFGGPRLLPVIKAALKGEIINVLIIDEHSARELAEGR